MTEIEVPCKFGRVEGDLTFPSDDSVSTLHGEFAVRGEDFYIIDLESTNGLYHNESQVLPNDESPLADDDLIEFGEQSFHIGISDAFEAENVQERYRTKKTEKIREKLNASKAERIRKIDSQIETINKKQKQINEQLSGITEKYKTGIKGQKGLEQKKSAIDQSINNFAELQTQHSKKLDDKKRELYKRKTDLDDEIKSNTVANATSSFWKKVHSEQIKLRTLFQPAPIDDNSIKKVSQNLLSFNAGSHTVIEFNEKGETDNYIQEGLYFDDLNYLLNIKDPGYGIDNDGFKGQDLSKIQKIRTCLVIDDYSIIGRFDDAEFSADDQPKGALYIGDTIIAPPMSYIPAFYDDAPRLVLGYYGSDANNLNINNNLAYRIFNDFTRLEVADTTVTDPVPSVPLSSVTIETVKALNLNWSSSASLHSQLHADLFSIRAKDGSTKGPAFLNSSTPSTTPRKPFAITTTVTSTDLGLTLDPVKSFTYKVLAPNERLNINHFQFNEQHRFYVLDEYGFDVNPTASIGPSSANNIFYYTPPIIE